MKKISDIPVKNPFKVPDKYFEEVNQKIISVTMDDDSKVIKVSHHNRFRTYLLIAASVAGFILISYSAISLLFPGKKDTKLSEMLYEMNPDSYINDIDITSLEEYTSHNTLSDEVQDVSKSDIIDYLILENVDINDIYEHL
jgi:hypothetical protein